MWYVLSVHKETQFFSPFDPLINSLPTLLFLVRPYTGTELLTIEWYQIFQERAT